MDRLSSPVPLGSCRDGEFVVVAISPSEREAIF